MIGHWRAIYWWEALQAWCIVAAYILLCMAYFLKRMEK